MSPSQGASRGKITVLINWNYTFLSSRRLWFRLMRSPFLFCTLGVDSLVYIPLGAKAQALD